MYTMVCNNCSKKSYSSSSSGEWECPYCGEHIEDEELSLI